MASVAPTHRRSAIGGAQAVGGVNLPLADLLIGACALELGYRIATSNVRDFHRMPGLAMALLQTGPVNARAPGPFRPGLASASSAAPSTGKSVA